MCNRFTWNCGRLPNGNHFPCRAVAALACVLPLVSLSQAAADPPRESREAKIDRLTRQIADLHAAGKYAEALPPAKDLASTARLDARAQYGLAGIYARLGKSKEAFACLEKAIRGHRVLPGLLEKDPDFASLKKDPHFAQMLNEAEADFQKAQSKAKSEWTVTLPHNYDPWKPTPMIMALHPYSGDAAEMQRLWAPIADEYGAVLVTPQGQVHLNPRGRSWGGRSAASPAVLSATGETKRRLRIDSTHTILTGFSQGGAMVYGAALTTPTLFRAIIPMSGPFSWQDDPAFKEGKLKGLRVFITIGDKDQSDNIVMNRLAASLFGRAGCDTRLRIYKDLGHELPRDVHGALGEALQFVWPDLKPHVSGKH